MDRFILVFTEDDKNKLLNQGLIYMGQQGNSYMFRNDSTIRLSSDIQMIKTNNICL